MSEEESVNINLKAGKLVDALSQHKKAILESKGVNSKLIAQMKKVQAIKEANDTSGILGKILAGGLVVGALKSLISFSPMLKQMAKLMQFSVMLILRPIGDFIGFMLRPIMVYMLRKFIIPWYQDVYPVMKNLGTTIGNMATGFLKNLSGENGIVLQLSTAAATIIGGGIAIKGAGKAGKAVGKIHGRIVRNIMGIEEKKIESAHSKRVDKLQKTLDSFKKSNPSKFRTSVNKFMTGVLKLDKIKLPSIKIPMPDWVKQFQKTVTPSTPNPGKIPVPNSTSTPWMKNGKYDAEAYKKWAATNIPKPGIPNSSSTPSPKPPTPSAKGGSVPWLNNGKYDPSAYEKWAAKNGIKLPSSKVPSGTGVGGILGGLGQGGGGIGFNAKLGLGGIRGGSGGTAMLAAQFVDLIPGATEFKNWFTIGLRDSLGMNDPERLKELGVNELGQKVTNVTVNIASIPDKSTADHLVSTLQGQLNK